MYSDRPCSQLSYRAGDSTGDFSEALQALLGPEAEVHESWDCEDEWDRPWYGRHRRWELGEDDEWHEEDEPPLDGPDRYHLVNLIESSVTLRGWIDESGKKATPLLTHVGDEEVCSTTPSSELRPYASEYEGYMGNYGNTMDRWYHRAALVLWPRARDFAVRAEASPSWAVQSLQRRLRSGDRTEAREKATSLLPFWEAVAPGEEGDTFVDTLLRVVEGLGSAALARSLLEPLRVERLTPRHASAWVALVQRYGEDWTLGLLGKWSELNRRWGLHGRDPLPWLTTLPRLSEALREADDILGARAARMLLENRWDGLKETVERGRDLDSPRRRTEVLTRLQGPIQGLLIGSVLADAKDLRDEVVAFLERDENESLVSHLVDLLREATKTVDPATRAAAGLNTLSRYCLQRLKMRLEAPARRKGDWSIPLPTGCDCELCAELGTFLAAPDQRRLEWPLAKAGRRHIHNRLDAHELPVHHATRRSGRPYTLVLDKTEALFDEEARQRRSWKADLKWLTRQIETARPGPGTKAKKRQKS